MWAVEMGKNLCRFGLKECKKADKEESLQLGSSALNLLSMYDTLRGTVETMFIVGYDSGWGTRLRQRVHSFVPIWQRWPL
jgi:hypothetical protein